MIPILFDEDDTIFTSNGIGRLRDAISCTCTEERNGMYELEMVYPDTGQYFDQIAINSIIVVIPFDGGTRQAFRVYLISKQINGRVTINARHISYQLSYIPCMPISVQASSSACADTMIYLKAKAIETCPFNFWTDVDTVAAFEQITPNSIRAMLGGIDGSVLDQFGGEYEWDNWTVKLHESRGTDSGYTLKYGKNLTDLKQEENIANTVTGIVPFWKDYTGSTVVHLTDWVIYSSHAGDYSYHLTVPVDFSDKFQNQPSQVELRNAAYEYVDQTDLGVPRVSIQVSFIPLWQTEEYKYLETLQTAKLCDTVNVEFVRLGIKTSAKIVKTVYNVLAERYDNIQIGTVRSSLFN